MEIPEPDHAEVEGDPRLRAAVIASAASKRADFGRQDCGLQNPFRST